MAHNEIINKKYWDNHWENVFKPTLITKNNYYSLFTSLFKKYLPYSKNFTCLEVGCVPGGFLINFKKIFGYKIYGIDYSDKIDFLKKNMSENKIKDYTVWHADLLKFKAKLRFDVVSSFGMLEHFIDPTPYIIKMTSLLKKGGYLIVEMPNFRNLQYILHYLNDKELLKKHNLKYMDINKLEKLISKNLHMKPIYAGYFGIIQDFPFKKSFPHNLLHYLTHRFNGVVNKLSLDVTLANPWTSTSTVYIGKKL